MKPHRQYHLSVWLRTQDFQGTATINATVIGADGGEGDIVQDDICYIAEIRVVRRKTRPAVNMKNSLKYQKRRLKTICSETPFMLRYHDSNVD